MLYPSLATVAFALLLFGFTRRVSSPRLHAGLMSSGMALDLALVLTLELSKDAVATALGGELTFPQRIHVATAASAVGLYFPVFVLGCIRLYRPSPANLYLRTWHRRLGYAALALRAISFPFMFLMLGRA